MTTKLETIWQDKQDEAILTAGQYITIYYPETVSGTSATYDTFFGESVDPNNPDLRSGVTTSTGVAFVISGIIYYGQGSLSLADHEIYHLPIGRFEPGQVVFTCRITDVISSGINKLEQSKYVILSTDSDKYIIQGYQKAGLINPYVYHVWLGKSNIESN